MIPPVGTRSGVPAVQGTNRLYFNLFLPPGAAPADGWPVAIYGHGLGDSMYGGPFLVAASLASQGIATASINAVGHGSGPLGTLNVTGPARRWPLPAGGRGFDQDGNGTIDLTEGVFAERRTRSSATATACGRR